MTLVPKFLLGQVCLLLVLTFSLVLNACAQKTKGSGNIKTENRDVSGFKIIHIGGSFNVELVPGNSEGVLLEADDNILPLILTKVSHETLSLELKGSVNNYKTLKATINYKDMEKIRASGSVQIKQTEKSKHGTLFMELSGSSKIKMNIEAKVLAMESSGASEMELKGEAETFNLDVSGAGEVKALKLETKESKVEISGAGNAELFVKEKLDVSISGAGSVKYKGNPAVVNQDVSGAGSVKKLADK